MSTQIPVELIDAILDRIDPSDQKSLAVASSLNSHWRTPAQTRLFSRITLSDAPQFGPLLYALSGSTFLASIVKKVSIGITPPLNWMLHPPSTNNAAAILELLPNVTSFHLEAQELNPLRWVWLPPKLKNAVKRILAFDFLEELIVDWWEFEMPADELYRMLLWSSQASLKRLTLNVPLKPLLAPSTRIGGGSSENQITLDLDYFEIATGDTYRTYYGPQSVDPLIHFIPPFTITSSNGLAFRVAAGMAKGFRFEDWYEQLRDLVAPCVKSLYIKGIDADPPFDLSNFTRLETLTVVPAPEYGRSCPRLAAETLKTVKHPNSLAFIQLASAADSGVHTTYFEEFLETLSSKKFPDLKTVNIYYEVEGMPSITERLQALVSSDRLRDEKFSLRLTFI